MGSQDQLLPMWPELLSDFFSSLLCSLAFCPRTPNAGLGGARYARAAEADPMLAFRAFARDSRSRCYPEFFVVPGSSGLYRP